MAGRDGSGGWRREETGGEGEKGEQGLKKFGLGQVYTRSMMAVDGEKKKEEVNWEVKMW